MSASLPLLSLYLSERCNSRCITCDFWRHGSRDLRPDDVRGLLPDLETLGTRDILISGGEPLLNPDWEEISELLRDQGFTLWLLTSGLSLAKHSESAAKLFESITVSLDGSCPDTYAAIRGVNAFDKVCEGIRAVAAAGVPTSVRVTLQRKNFREISSLVSLAAELRACQISFLAVDVGNAHAFMRAERPVADPALQADELAEFDAAIDELEADQPEAFDSGFIAESPSALRRIRDYFAALCGLGEFPPVRCNAPEFSAVVGADRRVSPCFFIPGPAVNPGKPGIIEALEHRSMRSLREAIRRGDRNECSTCVCSMWRDPEELERGGRRFRLVADA